MDNNIKQCSNCVNYSKLTRYKGICHNSKGIIDKWNDMFEIVDVRTNEYAKINLLVSFFGLCPFWYGFDCSSAKH